MAAALYARVSTTKQAEKDLSIPDQLQQMRDWCSAAGYQVAQEYVEPGASATDDRRPIFQRMISDATADPPPYEVVVVHSLSRFFRDSIEFGLYERKLNRAGVKLLSITQQTSDDPSGEMARKIFSVFDEYQSKENSKHTLRAMRENARQGYWNGAPPPFGYRTYEVDAVGNKGRHKKKLSLDPSESSMVSRIFALYLHGSGGGTMGAKQIASFLNQRGLTLRGSEWTRGRVHEILSNRTYVGEFYFNRYVSKTRTLKPESEWIRVDVPPIIDAQRFEEVQRRKSSRSFEKIAPRIVNAPTLLVGLLKCGCCGAGMTLVTGKSGRYRYYKCNNRISKGIRNCTNPAVAMDKLDSAVLNMLADKVFSPERVRLIILNLKKQIRDAKENENREHLDLQRELGEVEASITRLYEAVEKGFLPLDASLKVRNQKLQARKEEIQQEIAGNKRLQIIPEIKDRQVDLFCKALRMKLMDRSSGFGKEYLRRLVSEIRLTGELAEITGSKAALTFALTQIKTGTSIEVPAFVPTWLPDLGSNQGPTD